MPFQYLRQFKAVAADYEYYLSLSDEPVSVCLTERQMYILSVWNTYTPWMTRWYNTDDVSQAQLQLIAAELEDVLMCGCGVPVPSITDRLNSITYNTSTTTIYQATQNTWNDGGQTVYSIAPNLDYDTGDPGNIEKLICAALRNFLNAIIAQGKQMNQQDAAENADLVNTLSSALGGLSTAGGVAIGLGGAAAGVVGFFGGPWLVLGLALASVGLKVASLFMGADQSVFEDATAIDNVVCVMINNTRGENMTRAVFQAALTPNDFAPGSHEATIAAFVQPYLDDLTVYLQFLSLGNQLYEVSNFAEMPECGCVPVGAWEIETIPGYNVGTITAQTSNSVTFQAQVSDDTLWRVNAFRPTGCSTIATYGTTGASLTYTLKTLCDGTPVTAQIAVSDEIKQFAYAANAIFTVTFTW